MPPPSPTKVQSSNGIISLDPSKPIHTEIKPLILDILRTKHCIQGSVFLVEGIDVIGVQQDGRKAVRLLLGDGELVIQGLVRGSMHWVVDGGKVFEGGMDIRTVGWDEGYLEVLREEGREVKDVRELLGKKKNGEGKRFGLEARVREVEDRKRRESEIEREKMREEEERRKKEEGAAVEGNREGAEQGEKDEDYISESDYEEDGFERMEISTERATQRRAMVMANTGTNNTTPQRPPAFKQQPQQLQNQSKPPPQQLATPQPHISHPHSRPQPQNITPKPLPWLSNDPAQPLKLTPLSQIPHLPYKQNWMVNVLVIVTQLSEVEPCPYPPYVQRQARVVDQSTPEKHVHFTVFLEPEKFEPGLGEVVLLMGVKNHKLDGGSLKKYVSDRPKGGGRWWVEGRELGWCKGEVEGLREWWDQCKEEREADDG
ncbi:hypothetical protein B0T21DRAFT_433214 [Apiosordaria backusii]|uniref:Uncharacterized protein n=1 Tax=Apiosordaria backusii TaxID=314023 RepID=A0AA40ELZ6_9PEZI|nr:hypothetical protein B0T21DRAFT_433214 [Apiosordaria backusii]